jgi:transcriptional regulator with GAF, ATPase, and Fis domain
MNAPLPENDDARLEVLRTYEIPESASDAELNELAALAARVCGTPMAVIGVADADGLRVIGRFGLSLTETTGESSLCAHAMRQSSVFAVADASGDDRFHIDPLVAGDLHVRSCAGVPLVTPEGEPLGALFVMDRVARVPAAEQLAALGALGRQVMTYLELRRAEATLRGLGAHQNDVERSLRENITERHRAEELLRAITEGTAATTGTAFFTSLVRHLAAALRVRRVFVAECLSRDRARSRAVWMGTELPNFEYAYAETPCMKVVAGETCLYSRNVRQYFPANAMLAKLNAESYLGVPIWSSSQQVIGHMVIVDDKPMSEDPLWLSVLQIFAARAGAELEREQADEKLRSAMAEVERLKNQLQAENVYLQEEIRKEHNFEEMVGNSPALLSLLRKVERVASTDATVLIQGETGTGKELIARALHDSGPRKHRPLVKVNCGAVPPSLLESELFGHVKGAFTGAIDRRVGRFELANGGTLFLDEIGELPLETQVKLLRVLQEQEFEPVGSSRTVRVDVRIIAATNRDLNDEVRGGRFRSDLFFRLNVVPLAVPPLRERAEDIPLLVTYFLSRFGKKFGRTIDGVTRDTVAFLTKYPWPGNVRELQNVIERAVVLSPGRVLSLGADLLPVTEQPSIGVFDTGGGALRDASINDATDARSMPLLPLSEAERLHIETVLNQTGGVIEGPAGAAKILNLHPNTLRSRMKKLGIRRTHEIS